MSKYTTPDQNLRRRIVAEWDTMERADKRTMLQALPLIDLTALCHLLAEHRPARYLTPDVAWHAIRLFIEPDPWAPDIVLERWASGDHYVFYFGGRAVACRSADVDGAHWALWQTACTFFRCCYAERLTDVATDLVWTEVRRVAA